MNARNALIVAYYFPPMGLSGVQRVSKFVKYLPEHGIRPIVLTSAADSYYAFDDRLLEELPEDVLIYRTVPGKNSGKKKNKAFPNYFAQKIGRAALQTVRRPDSKRPWMKEAIELGETIFRNNRIDVIFASAPPFTGFMVARELSKRYDVPYVADYRDVWIDNPFHFYATPFHKNYDVKLERDILTHCEKATVTFRHTKELMLKRYSLLDYNDITILPHGYDPEDFERVSGIEPPPDKFVLTHSGLFQDDRTPKYFLKALAEFLRKNPKAKSHVSAAFVGLMRKNHLKMIKKFGLDQVVDLVGYVSHEEAVRRLASSSVLWLTLNDRVRSPGKLYEYFGAGKPIICCSPDGEIRKLAAESKAAVTVGPKDVAAIERAISSLYELWKRKELPVPKREFVERFDRRKLTGELAKILSHAASI